MTSKYITALASQQEELQAYPIEGLCTRKEESQFDLQSSLAQVVIGVRRSGKSTLCIKILKESGVNFAYVNFDDERLCCIKTDELDSILQDLYTLYGIFTHILLDEIQNIEAWPLFVNRMLRQGIHVVLTGSNANLLSNELVTHLTGRYNQIELFPFSFQEYCTYLKIDTKSLSTKAMGLRTRALNEYMMQGGFPELLHEASMPRHSYFQSLLHAIVEKDICKRYKVRHKQTIYELANKMLDWFCQEKSYNAIAKELHIESVHTVKNYLQYLSNAYLLCPIPLFSLKSRERSAARKCYSVDLAFIEEHDNALMTESYGLRLENVIALELLRHMHLAYEQLYYLRRPQEYECDFVVVESCHVKKLIQVTYDFRNPSTKQYNREINGLCKAAHDTGCKDLTLIMMYGDAGDVAVGEYVIHKVLAIDWLLDSVM